MMTFRPSAPNKKRRWAALLAIVVLGTGIVGVGTAFAAPTYSFQEDVQGANDEPGQKDLTAQASAFDAGDFFTAWKWDDTSFSGKNTGDGCALFTSDADLFVDYAICGTVGTKNAVLQMVTVYSCNDTRPDRCSGPTLLATFVTGSAYCTVTNSAPGQFGDASDTLISCNVTDISEFFNPDITALAGSSLLNTCSYPSREPNSDPSDCVLLVPANTDVSLGTDSRGSSMDTWSVTLRDTATLVPAGTGSVTFNLYSGTPCVDPSTGVTGNRIQTNTDSTPADGFTATPKVITQADVTGAGPWTYYWTVTYNPGTGFNGDQEACSEATTITASVQGTLVSP
jgi:hypothetical protein